MSSGSRGSLRHRRLPKYRRHKPSGQAVVTLSGRDFYLGKYGSIASRAEYDRLIAEYVANGWQLPEDRGSSSSSSSSDITVKELILGFMNWAKGYYRKAGQPTGEVENIKYSLRPLRQLYGHTLARDFSPLALNTVRQEMIRARLCRNVVNRRIHRVIHVFAWGVENMLVPPSVHYGLKAVAPLRMGRSEARESAPVQPVPEAHVSAIEPHVSRQVWAMIELQWLSGMRPGEVTIMRSCDLDTSGKVWVYTPSRHKTEHHGRGKQVYLGPKAQEILRPWIRPGITAEVPEEDAIISICAPFNTEYLFSPAAAEAVRRRSDLPPDRTPGRRVPQDHYTTSSYRHAIRYGCQKAGIPPWHPNQLRHNAATRFRKELGLDLARAILGHSSVNTTEIYAERDEGLIRAAMERFG